MISMYGDNSQGKKRLYRLHSRQIRKVFKKHRLECETFSKQSYEDDHLEYRDSKLSALYFMSMEDSKAGLSDVMMRPSWLLSMNNTDRYAPTLSRYKKHITHRTNTNRVLLDVIYQEKLKMINDPQKDIYQQMIDIIPFIDPDTTRMIEWCWARRMQQGLNSFSKTIEEPIDTKIDFGKLIELMSTFVDHSYSSDTFFRGVKVNTEKNIIDFYVLAEKSSSTNIIHLFGNKDIVVDAYDKAKKLFVTNKSIVIDSLMGFSQQGPITSSTKLVYSEQKLPTDEFYPWLTEGIDAFVEGYKNSASGVLVLIGAPGTGKTSFLKALMFKLGMENNGLVTSDAASLDPSLLMWLSEKGNDSMIAFEDADNLVSHRKDGNTQMSGILNYAEGVISNNIKLIISTNLSSTSKIDPALIRPGRAYRVLTFVDLTADEANNARESIGLARIKFTPNKKYTLSEALNYIDDADLQTRENKRIGFL